MRYVSRTFTLPAKWIVGIGLGLFAGLLTAAIFDSSPTWHALFLSALFVGLVMVYSRNVKTTLLVGNMLALIFELQKSIIAPTGKVAPGLFAIPSDAMLAPLLVIMIWEKLVVRKERLRTPYGFWPALAVLSWVYLSGLLADDYFDGLLASLNWTRYFIAYFVLADVIRDPFTFRAVLYSLGGGLVLNLGMAAAQYITKQQLALQGSRITTLGVKLVFASEGVSAFRPSGFYGHPNQFACNLMFVLTILLAVIFLRPSRVGKWVWGTSVVLFAGGAGALALTLSRGGWISFGVAACAFMAVGFFIKLVKNWQIVAILVSLAFGAAVVVAVFPSVLLRITSGDHRSTESRFALNDQAMLIIWNHPILGCGPGHYNREAQVSLPQSFTRLNPYYRETLLKGVVHNTYLLLPAELGLVGGVLVIVSHLVFACAFFRVRRWHDPVNATICLALCSGVVGQLSFYMFDKFYYDLTLVLLWNMFGLIAAIVRINEIQLSEDAVDTRRRAAVPASKEIPIAPADDEETYALAP